MGYKTLLVHMDNSLEAEARLFTAVELADRWSSRIIGVGGCLPAWAQQPSAANLDGEPIQFVTDFERLEIQAAKARFGRMTDFLEASAVWRSGAEHPDQLAISLAAGADLVVAGSGVGLSAGAVDPAALALCAGVPLLALPARLAVTSLRHVIVAWKNVREARRALTDALPLLLEARSVHVVEVVSEAAVRETSEGLGDVIGRLAANGVAATGERTRRVGGDDAETLLACARRRSTDLIVAGAFGRSRLPGWSLGDVTEGLLRRSSIPLLLSH